MPKKRIFIGSASETKYIAAPIASCLSKRGFSVEPWWDNKVFEPGDVTIDKLRWLAKEVDGAVFVWKGTDVILVRDMKRNAARDNVMIEFGMFVQELGRGRCVFVKDKDTHVPSDLDGVTFISLVEDDDFTTAEAVANHFERQFAAATSEDKYNEPDVYLIETDPSIMRITSGGQIPPGWSTRALFFGTEGAQNWLAVDKQTAYLPDHDKEAMYEQVLRVIDHIKDADEVPILTCVSLGPGSARVDREMIKHLNNGRRSVQYIPVDISDGLLTHASYALHDCAQVPFGILTDFEQGVTFIKSRLAHRVHSPTLFSLVGNTLGNLDNYERSFMEQMQRLLNKDDYLLIEVAIKFPGWELKKDIRYNLDDHTLAMKHFYSQGLARHNNEGVQSIVDAYSQRIKVKEGHSNVPGATSIDYVDAEERIKIMSLRRYDWKRFLSWLEIFDFSILGGQKLKFKKSVNIGIGTVLLKKR